MYPVVARNPHSLYPVGRASCRFPSAFLPLAFRPVTFASCQNLHYSSNMAHAYCLLQVSRPNGSCLNVPRLNISLQNVPRLNEFRPPRLNSSHWNVPCLNEFRPPLLKLQCLTPEGSMSLRVSASRLNSQAPMPHLPLLLLRPNIHHTISPSPRNYNPIFSRPESHVPGLQTRGP